MIPTTLVFTEDLLHPAGDKASAAERELFYRAESGAMSAPDPRTSRELGLELIARAGAVAHILVVFVYHGQLGFQGVDWHSGDVSVRPSIAVGYLAGRRSGHRISDFGHRLSTVCKAIDREEIPGERVVIVDRALAADPARFIARGAFKKQDTDLHLIDPGPWGLTEASHTQVCQALRIDVGVGLVTPQAPRPCDDQPF